MIAKQSLTKERLEFLFAADLQRGRLYWRNVSKYHAEKVGQEAGCPVRNHCNKFYWVVTIDGRKYKRAHLIFCLAYGRFPSPMVDHKNGDSLNDAISNLRNATVTQNAWNHKTRKRRIALPMGVRFSKRNHNRFEARISFHGKQIALGTFDSVEHAQEVYASKRKELYGEFA